MSIFFALVALACGIRLLRIWHYHHNGDPRMASERQVLTVAAIFVVALVALLISVA